MGVSQCSSNCASVPSAAWLTVCICIERLKLCMAYYDVVNLVTVTKTIMIRQNSLWLRKNHCYLNMATSFPQKLCRGLVFSWSLSQIRAEVSGAPKFNYSRSQISEHLRMLLQSVKAPRLGPEGSGSIWKYLEELVRSPGVSGWTECCFWTDLNFTDGVSSLWGITTLLVPAVLDDMSLALTINALQQILRFRIVLIVSPIPLETFATFNGVIITAFATPSFQQAELLEQAHSPNWMQRTVR